jgi:ABC-type enterochelin transport system substrate-binding protein
MDFATLMTRTNASVLRQLANARVRIDGAEEQPGIFKEPSNVVALGLGAADTSPTVHVSADIVPADAAGKLIEINGMPFAIVLSAPDGTGLARLTVEHVE